MAGIRRCTPCTVLPWTRTWYVLPWSSVTWRTRCTPKALRCSSKAPLPAARRGRWQGAGPRRPVRKRSGRRRKPRADQDQGAEEERRRRGLPVSVASRPRQNSPAPRSPSSGGRADVQPRALIRPGRTVSRRGKTGAIRHPAGRRQGGQHQRQGYSETVSKSSGARSAEKAPEHPAQRDPEVKAVSREGCGGAGGAGVRGTAHAPAMRPRCSKIRGTTGWVIRAPSAYRQARDYHQGQGHSGPGDQPTPPRRRARRSGGRAPGAHPQQGHTGGDVHRDVLGPLTSAEGRPPGEAATPLRPGLGGARGRARHGRGRGLGGARRPGRRHSS